MIKNLVFDFGKVLVDYDFTKMLASIFDNPAEIKEFYSILCSPEFCNRCDKGDTPFIEIAREYQRKYPKWERQIQAFYDRQTEAITGEVPGMKSLLSRLREHGFALYGLTNWASTIYPVRERFEILRMMDGTVISSEEHMIKPDPEIYRLLCRRYSLKMDECLFTDDKQVNVDGALAVGMKAILFKDAGQYEMELRKMSVLI